MDNSTTGSSAPKYSVTTQLAHSLLEGPLVPRRRPTVDTLLFIPDDIVAAFQNEAVLQVAESWAERPLRPLAQMAATAAARPRIGGLGPVPKHGVLLFAALLALVGWAVCTGVWTWFAIDTGATMWKALAGVGAVALILGAVATTRLMLAPRPRRQPAGAHR